MIIKLDQFVNEKSYMFDIWEVFIRTRKDTMFGDIELNELVVYCDITDSDTPKYHIDAIFTCSNNKITLAKATITYCDDMDKNTDCNYGDFELMPTFEVKGEKAMTTLRDFIIKELKRNDFDDIISQFIYLNKR